MTAPAGAGVLEAIRRLPDASSAALEAAGRLAEALRADIAMLLLEGRVDAPAAARRPLPPGALEAARRRLAEALAAEGARIDEAAEPVIAPVSGEPAAGPPWDLIFPVRRDGRTVGGWIVAGRGEAPGAAAAEAAGREAVLVADAVAAVSRLLDELSAAAGRLEAIGAVGGVIRDAGDLDRTLARLLEISLRLVGAEVGAISLRGPAGLEPPRIAWGLGADIVSNLARPDGRGVLEEVAATGAPFVAPDAAAALDVARLPRAPTSVAAFPLAFEGETFGVLVVAHAPAARLGGGDVAAVSTVCSLAAAALAGARRAEERLAAERLEREVAIAREIQARLLPRDLPPVPGWTVAGATEAAREVGGDYFDVFPLGGGRWGLVVADVSGKGVPAAILMTGLRAYLRVRAAAATSAADVVGALNRHFAEDVTEDRFATLVYAVVEAESGAVEVASAGHLPPLVARAGGAIEAVEGGGAPLGIDPAERYAIARLSLAPGDRLVLYTDGLVEAPVRGGLYGEARLRAALGAARGDAHATLAALRADLAAASVGPPRDDLTILVLARA